MTEPWAPAALADRDVMRPQETATPRREIPLVEIADVPIGANGGDIEGDVAGGMGAVRQNHDAAVAAGPRHFGDRKHQRRRRSHMIENRQSRARRQRCADRFDA